VHQLNFVPCFGQGLKKKTLLLKTCQSVTAISLAVLVGCTSFESREHPDLQTMGVPDQFQLSSGQGNTINPVLADSVESPILANTQQTRWVKTFNDSGLTVLVERVLANNSGLAAEAAKVKSAGAGQIQADSALYPTLDLTGSVSQSQTNDVQSSNSSVSLKAGFELDIWGKLSAKEQEASLDYAAARADFSVSTLALTAETANAWYNLITQRQLLNIYQRREDTLANALTVIKQGYGNGLKEVEDLYSAQDNLQSEQDNIAAQKQVVSEQVRALQVLLGRYPDGRLLHETELELPALPPLASKVMPSELISRSPSLQSEWLSLLAADAALAAAHRDRFPSLSLSASVDQNIDWNLMASLTQPLFNAGKLAAAEDQAEANAQQLEKRYLQSLFSAFADVENALMQEATLQHRRNISENNLQIAQQTTTLTLSQYKLGLVELDSLLMVQKKMLDAEAQVLNVHLQQIENRIELYRLMGGNAEPPSVASKAETKISETL